MMLWKTRSGELISLSRMTEAHLNNALRMCIRTERWWAVKLLAAELDRRLPDGELNMGTVLDDCVVGGCDRYGSLES